MQESTNVYLLAKWVKKIKIIFFYVILINKIKEIKILVQYFLKFAILYVID